jgi:hypothetical protein
MVTGEALFEALNIGTMILPPGAVAVGGLQGEQNVIIRQRPRGRPVRTNGGAAKESGQ